MIRITLMDGSTHEIARGDARALLPYVHVFTSSFLKDPIAAIVCYQGEPLPVLGPLPPALADTQASVELRPWLLVLDDHAQVIRGLPDFAVGAEHHALTLAADPAPLPKSA
jgi:hypothetical protein